ncbi:hypothetical protein [Psychrobacillus sp.]|uniref:hypothetical protein n=1 Tax=Psychrobacillus sp. TaxID=1871623 RepID=UPI0028BDD384|nr:hypothetical protein [Psychrobacillus sp.]
MSLTINFRGKLKSISFKPIVFLITIIIGALLVSACSEEQKATRSEELLAYLKDYDEIAGKLTFDEIEWVDHQDIERVKELGLDLESDLPSGFLIYNESEQTESLIVSKTVEIDIVNGSNLQEPLSIAIDEFSKIIDRYKVPFYLTIKDDEVVKISEKYTP